MKTMLMEFESGHSLPHRLGHRRKLILAFLLCLLVLALAGCERAGSSGAGFRLPEGNAEKGKTAFVALKCHTCHAVDGVELPTPDSKGPIHVVIGGEVGRVKTYEELVTAIIHPSADFTAKFNPDSIKEGKLSPMGEFNDLMNVSQMIDIVAFLQPRYRKLELNYPYYP